MRDAQARGDSLMRRLRSESGRTLLEVTIGLFLGSMLMVVVLSAQMASMRFFARDTDRLSRIQAIRNGLDRMTADLREGENVLLEKTDPADPYFNRIRFTYRGGTMTYYFQNGELMRDDGGMLSVAAAPITELRITSEASARPTFKLELFSTTESGAPIRLETRVSVRLGGGAP